MEEEELLTQSNIDTVIESYPIMANWKGAYAVFLNQFFVSKGSGSNTGNWCLLGITVPSSIVPLSGLWTSVSADNPNDGWGVEPTDTGSSLSGVQSVAQRSILKYVRYNDDLPTNASEYLRPITTPSGDRIYECINPYPDNGNTVFGMGLKTSLVNTCGNMECPIFHRDDDISFYVAVGNSSWNPDSNLTIQVSMRIVPII